MRILVTRAGVVKFALTGRGETPCPQFCLARTAFSVIPPKHEWSSITTTPPTAHGRPLRAAKTTSDAADSSGRSTDHGGSQSGLPHRSPSSTSPPFTRRPRHTHSSAKNRRVGHRSKRSNRPEACGRSRAGTGGLGP